MPFLTNKTAVAQKDPRLKCAACTHKPRKLRYFGGKQTPTETYKTQLARLNICVVIGENLL